MILLETVLKREGAESIAVTIARSLHFANRKHSTQPFYIGYTGVGLRQEGRRWLTKRGALTLGRDGQHVNTGRRNRPVLEWKNDVGITMKDAEEKLGFTCVQVYKSRLMCNARQVERALQLYFKDLPLGERLWRVADMGKKWDQTQDGHQVFITISPRVAQQIALGIVVVQP